MLSSGEVDYDKLPKEEKVSSQTEDAATEFVDKLTEDYITPDDRFMYSSSQVAAAFIAGANWVRLNTIRTD